MNPGMEMGLYLQVVSILMAIVGVAVPALIAIVGFVFVRNLNERIDDLSDQVDQLWGQVNRDDSCCGFFAHSTRRI